MSYFTGCWVEVGVSPKSPPRRRFLQLSWVLAVIVPGIAFGRKDVAISRLCPLPETNPNPLRIFKSPAFLPGSWTALNNHRSSKATCRISWGLGGNHVTVRLLPLCPPASLAHLEVLILTLFPDKPPAHSEHVPRGPPSVHFASIEPWNQTDTLRNHILSHQPTDPQTYFINRTRMYLSSF